MKIYYYIYQIRNKINNKIYVGVHKTINIDDGYMGSGKLLKRAIKKYGIENFEKIILNVFDSEKEMFKEEVKIVNSDFLKRDDVYNIALGGNGGIRNKGWVTVKDKDGNIFSVSTSDPRYLSGELKYYFKGRVTVKDKDGNTFSVSTSDPRYLSGELISHNNGMAIFKDKDGKTFYVSKSDPRYLSGEFVGSTKGKVLLKDKNGKHHFVDKTDSRYLSGELVPIWTNQRHTEESKKKISEANSISRRGKGNSQYGTMWIYSDILKQSKKMMKNEKIPLGWKKGRKFYK